MQNRSQAVMANRAPGDTEDDDPKRAIWRKLDWFATPPWASRAGAELVCEASPLSSVIWEPAAGDGIMASVLAEYFDGCFATDIFPQREGVSALDFLDGKGRPDCDWIITNPPFTHAQAFVEEGLKHARAGVAVLCRLAFVEGGGRYRMHAAALSTMAPFSERVPMQLGPWDPTCSTATAYGWFIYKKRPKLGLPVLNIIPPGTRSRLTKPDDVRRFCKVKTGSLL